MWCSQGDGAGSINQKWSSEQCDEMVESNLTQSLKYFQNVSDVEAKYGDMPQVWFCRHQDGLGSTCRG